jgi:hypothetical protein
MNGGVSFDLAQCSGLVTTIFDTPYSGHGGASARRHALPYGGSVL